MVFRVKRNDICLASSLTLFRETKKGSWLAESENVRKGKNEATPEEGPSSMVEKQRQPWVAERRGVPLQF